MSVASSIGNIRELVKQNKLDAAIKLLGEEGMMDMSISLERQRKSSIESSLEGTLSREDLIIQENKIAKAILACCISLEERLEQQNKSLDGEETNPQISKFLYIIPVFIIFLGGLIYLFIKNPLLNEPDVDFFSSISNYNILILPFNSYLGEKERLFHYEIRDTLIHIARVEELPLEAKVLDTISKAWEPKEVQELGKSLEADLVVYGNYKEPKEEQSVYIKIRYESLDSLNNSTLFRHDESETFLLPKVKVLEGGQITGPVEEVVYFSLALRSFFANEHESVIKYLTNVPVLDKKEFGIIHYLRGYSLMSVKKFPEAIDEIEKAIDLDKNRPEYFSVYGAVLGLNGDVVHSIQAFKKALTFNVDDVAVQTNLTLMYIKNEEYEEAMKSVQYAISKAPFLGYLYYLRGRILTQQNALKEALIDFTKAIELSPEYPLAYYARADVHQKLNNSPEAIADFEKSIELDKGPDSLGRAIFGPYEGRSMERVSFLVDAYVGSVAESALHQQVNFLFQQNNLKEARLLVDELLDRNPQSQIGIYTKGQLLLAQAKYDSAMLYTRKLAELAPNTGLPLFLDATIFFKKGDKKNALTYLDSCISLYPTFTNAYLLRASIQEKERKWRKALADYSKVVELDSNVLALNKKAEINFLLGELGAALRDFRTTIEKDPCIASAYLGRANSYKVMGYLDQAEKSYTNYLQKIKYDDEVVILDRAEVRLNNRKYKQSIADFTYLINGPTKRNLAPVYNLRGLAYFKLRRFNKAKYDFSASIKHLPKYSFAYANRARVFLQKNILDSAKLDIEQALALNPNLADAFYAQGNLAMKSRDFETALKSYSKAIEKNR